MPTALSEKSRKQSSSSLLLLILEEKAFCCVYTKVSVIWSEEDQGKLNEGTMK
jgi:hypothetical protein